MADEITDGSLSWTARIDTSELAQDIKSIAELFQKVGGNVDLSAIDEILKQQADREVGYRKDVAQKVIALNQDIITDAKEKANDLQKYIESIPFEFKTGEDKQLTQAEIDAINANNKGIPITNQSPQYINKPTFQTDPSQPKAFSNTDAINQARDAYKNADAVTKQYLDDLVSLEFQLKNLRQAQIDLNTSLKDGKVSEEQYLSQSSQLKAAIGGVNTELAGVKNAQATYIQGLNGEGEATQKNVSILTEYRQLRNQIASDQAKGIFNEADVERAVQLEHSIRNVNAELHLASSNTAFVDAAASGIQGMVGAFTALSGVMGLLTDNNEKANKIMQDTISFLGILNGLQQLGQTLAAEGPLNKYINGLLRRNTALDQGAKSQIANNAATEASTKAQVINNEVVGIGTIEKETNVGLTKADTGAKITNTEVTNGATTAQEGLNTAMELNPAAILILAITTIISAYEAFADSADKATEAQQKLNDVLDFNKTFSDDTVNSMKQRGAEEIALMKAQGATEFAIREEQRKQLEAQLATFREDNQKTIDEGEKAAAKYEELAKNGFKEKKQVTEYSQAGTPYTYDVYNDVDEKYLEQLKATKEKGAAIQKEQDKLTSEINIKRYENITANYADEKKADDKSLEDKKQADADAKKLHDKALASDAEYWASKVELARKGSKEWLDAQLKLNQSQYNKAIDSGTNSDKANADKTVADNNANDTFNLAYIQDTEDIISKQLAAVTQGSQEELALKLQLLEQEKQASIISAQGNAAAIEKINAESLKKQSDLKEQYATLDAETFQRIQQNQLKIILAGLTEGSDEFLKFSKEAANQSAAASVTEAIKNAAANNPSITASDITLSSTFNEKAALAFADRIESIDKDLAVKIRATYAETDAKKMQLDNEVLNNYIDNQNKIIDSEADIKKTPNNAIINNQNSTDTQKAVAEFNNNQIDIEAEKKKLQDISDGLEKAGESAQASGDKFSQQYIDAKAAVDKYIVEVQKDFSKIKDLSNPDSDISKALDGLKDPKVKQELLADVSGLKDLQIVSKQLEQQKFTALLKDVSAFGAYISQAGNDISQLNDGLGDTISTLGDLISLGADLASGIKEISSGIKDMHDDLKKSKDAMSALNTASLVLLAITLVIKAISAVVKLFSQAKKTAEESAAQMQQYQDDLVVGQIKYNEELLTSKKIQDDLVKGTLDQLNAQIQLNNEKKSGYQTDLDSLTAQLAQSGQYISGEHTEKYGGVLGIGRKTKVVQDFSSLGITTDMTDDQIAAILKEKETMNQLTGSTKEFADEWLAVYDNISQATDQSEQLKEQLTEAFAGTTADDIAKSIVDGLQQGKVAAAQWGDDFNKIISNALLSSITNTLESGAVAKIWATLQANINPDGTVSPISPDEIATLKKQYSDAVDQGNALLQQAESIFPDLASTLNNSNTLSGAIQGSLTEDTANELAGLYRNQLDVTKQTYSVAVSSLSVQQMIEANTANALALFAAHLPMLSQYLPFLKTINDNTVPAQLKRDFGL